MNLHCLKNQNESLDSPAGERRGVSSYSSLPPRPIGRLQRAVRPVSSSRHWQDSGPGDLQECQRHSGTLAKAHKMDRQNQRSGNIPYNFTNMSQQAMSSTSGFTLYVIFHSFVNYLTWFHDFFMWVNIVLFLVYFKIFRPSLAIFISQVLQLPKSGLSFRILQPCSYYIYIIHLSIIPPSSQTSPTQV